MSDCRMSGTAFGTIVLHITPEAAAGGPLALAETGDRIRLSVRERTLDLLVAPEVLDAPPRRVARAGKTRARLGPHRRRPGAAGRPGVRFRGAAPGRVMRRTVGMCRNIAPRRCRFKRDRW